MDEITGTINGNNAVTEARNEEWVEPGRKCVMLERVFWGVLISLSCSIETMRYILGSIRKLDTEHRG